MPLSLSAAVMKTVAARPLRPVRNVFLLLSSLISLPSGTPAGFDRQPPDRACEKKTFELQAGPLAPGAWSDRQARAMKPF